MEGYVLFDENELKKHFNIITNKATGNCLFESLAQNMLYFNEGETIPFQDSRYGKVLKLAEELREKVCDFYSQFIRQGWANFPGPEQSDINDHITSNMLNYVIDNKDQYHAKKICNNNEWGDTVDALIICKLYDCNLTIYSRIRKETYQIFDFINNTDFPTYRIRHFDLNDPNAVVGNHYEACIPIPIPKLPDEKSTNKNIEQPITSQEPQFKIQKEKSTLSHKNPPTQPLTPIKKQSTPSRKKPPTQPLTPIKKQSTPSREKPPTQIQNKEQSTLSHEKSPNKNNEQSKSIENLNFDDFNELFKKIIIRDYENQNFDKDLKNTIATAIDRNQNEQNKQNKIVYDLMWDLNDTDFDQIKLTFQEAEKSKKQQKSG